MKRCWKLRLNKLSILLIFLAPLPSFAQYDKIEEGYFQFPIQPERTNYLAGNMGELRASHFHAGLDIKTNGIEGLEVYAAAEGYVSRIAVSTGGYGNALYIAHPNGTTTVYAHLQKFNDIIAKYVLENQYQRKSFTVNLFPERNQFKLKQGDVIGFSGNSGSSTGPHLHFEIRNINHQVLDPLRFGFAQVKDQIAPIAQRIALKTMDISSRVNGEFGRFEFNLEKRGNEYVIADTIEASGKIGLELWAHDKLDGAANRNGIPEIDVYKNRELLFRQRIDTVSFGLQNNIKVHTNYQAEYETRRRYNKLYIDDGNDLQFYKEVSQYGFFYPKADSLYLFQVILTDAYDNQRRVSFNVKGVAPSTQLSGIRYSDHGYMQDNTLQLRSSRDSTLNKITIYTTEGSTVLDPSYYDHKENIYLIDLKKGIPRKINYGHKEEDPGFSDMILPGKEHAFLGNTFSVTFGKTTLFDTLYLKSGHYIDNVNQRDILELGPESIPLKGLIEIELSPIATYDSLQKYTVYAIDNPAKPGFIGGEWQENKIRFASSSLGKFTLLKDEIPPTIKSQNGRPGVLYFIIDDALSGVKEYEAKLNGEWILMHYDPKKSLIWSERLDKSKPLKGDFDLTVTDNAGNKTTLTLKL